MATRPGSSAEQVLPLSTRQGADNILEIGNTLSQAVELKLVVYGESGAPVTENQYRLKAHEQFHLNVGDILGAEENGVAVVTAGRRNAVVTSNLYYYRDQTGRVQAVVALDGASAQAAPAFGTYNFYLGMKNYLRVVNMAGVKREFSVQVRGGQERVQLESRGSLEIPLQESQEFTLEPNTLGMLSLDEAVAGASVGYVFRFKPGADGNIDFVVAGKVR